MTRLRIATVCLLAVLAWSCRESRTTITTTAQPPSQAPAASTATEAAPKEVVEQSVVRHDRADVGALEVKALDPKSGDWFDVLRDGKRAFSGNPRLLNSTIELPPGDYVVDVNKTQRPITLEAGKKIVLWTGELEVAGEPSHAFWYPMQGSERKLSSNPPLFNRSRALFPGTYTVFVYVSVTTGDERLGDAEVRPAQKTVLRK